jgi:hypothetical protein
MTPDIEALNGLARAWMGLVWAVMWQSTLLVGVFALVALGMRRSSPSLRYWFWQIAAIKLLLMPLWSVSILLPATPPLWTGARMDSWPAARPGSEIGLTPEDRRLARDQDAAADGLPHEGQASGPWIARVEWQAWVFLVWGLAVMSQIAAIAHQRSRLERLLRQAAPGDDPALLALVVELSGRIGLRPRPSVTIIDDEGSPFVCGLWRPSLVLPRGLTSSLDLESLRSVLLHELAHIRRRDLLWDWIPAIARLLYFFHPAAHFIVARARLERELACDQTAMVLTGLGAAGYASTLVEIVSRSSAPPALQAALAAAGLDGAAPSPARWAGIEITPS